MLFDAKISEMVRKAVTEGRHDLLYAMVPAIDDGQTYEMKCKICSEFGNIMASKFSHAEGCPVDTEEKRSSQRVKEMSPQVGQTSPGAQQRRIERG
jgi:hypothetical protein